MNGPEILATKNCALIMMIIQKIVYNYIKNILQIINNTNICRFDS